MAALLAALAALAAACTAPEPEKDLVLSDVEAYWAIDSTAGDTVYVAPVVRFRLANKSATQSIEATATFRRKGETANWGSAWERVSWSQRRVAPGETVTLALKSDGRYYTTGAPESVFSHAEFKDARVEVFLRVGSSPWAKMAAADVERRIGSKTVVEFTGPPPS